MIDIKSIMKLCHFHRKQIPIMCKFIRYAYAMTTASNAAERELPVMERSFYTSHKVFKKVPSTFLDNAVQ